MALIAATVIYVPNYYYYEGSTNMMAITPPNVYAEPMAQCYCTTNNCNANLDTCASGLNYSSSLLFPSSTTLRPSNTTIPTILSTMMNTTVNGNINPTTTLLISSNRITSSISTVRSNTTVRTTTQATPTTTPASDRPACFSSDSQIKMANGTYKRISEIQPGDRVAATEESDIVLILDSHSSEQALFYTIETSSGKRISLTANHLIAVGLATNRVSKIVYKFAKNIKVGETLLNDQLLPEPVVRIKQEIKVGYYAPMSGAGILSVNGLLASCYANVFSHQLAHWMMAPARLNYRLQVALGIKQHFHQDIGLHPFAAWIMKWAERLLPKQFSILIT
ncbi:unnamed protein product [Rotaria sp. Silwood2]|nr:unnamed protein product [Rotaria sp. Silwood2]CAF2984733.1 unnamed protein product [Rotaria sp. Silwood2]CAF3351504.1 unnamed protein product [Rotaria sp. Silwood2]CAF4034859.1 unnamed protein product [Rotaria sp. Silwood2]CAF4151348.1 unnamed protein product [Rotaria sp. Silwood2]